MLADEHIIPEGLGGNVVLPQASCGACESAVTWFEQFCLKQLLGRARYRMGLGRRRKSRPKTLPMEFSDNDVWKTREIPVEQTPAFMVLPVLERPDAILRKMPHNRGMITGFWHGKPEPAAWNELREAHGGMPMRTGSIKLDEIRFVLFLAKIAHGFAMVHRDRFENFIPLLPELILRKPSRFPMAYLIGGETEQEEATAATHSMELLHVADDIGELLAVRIRLFGHWGAPTYQVVAAASPLAYHRMCEFTEAK